ncbi:glycerate kinase type-2 family protein [Urbifossiella limnaea]|uniref:glycerate kinase type-2 family protein n=1 Tax=Urbifossiella limnaea TaxID=2528023 RepID=UPI0011A1A8AB|nr:DUF4147 domain-containing protein [Urbifossiella limnaea]
MRDDALAIWSAAVRAADPERLVRESLAREPLPPGQRLLILGAGKAGAAMLAGLGDYLDAATGIVNVPAGQEGMRGSVRLHAARPAGVNEPTAAGVAGAEEMLKLLADAGPDDVAVCLLSGGGSALLPAPAAGVTLDDKLAVTRLLHRSGATIDEMNCVRKHLSRVKGGRLAAAFRGKLLLTLIVSDVVGDPLDVIASGPTAPDPTTFADAVAVLARYGLTKHVPPAVNQLLARGTSETLKVLPPHVVNRVIGSNRVALDAAAAEAERRGYRVLDLGAFVEGETAAVAAAVAGVVRSIRRDAKPIASPACVLIGGETTVTLGDHPGKGGRNQEFVLALMLKLAATPEGMAGVTVLSGGTDGEDGPTDAAGAVADAGTLERGRDAAEHLRRHDAYPYFAATGDLLKPGLTGTNVMDVRVVLVT